MMRALIENGALKTYPYVASQLRADNPDVSFPTEISEVVWAEFGVVEVQETARPEPALYHYVMEGAPELIEGVWTQTWAQYLKDVPSAISPLQARRALRATGLKPAVDAYVATLSEEDQETWEYAIEVRRDNAIIAAGAAQLGLGEADIDNLFRLGETL